MGRSSLVVAASLLASALLGGAQALALVVVCGTDPRIEAFLAAYALYLPVAVLGASLRATVSSLASRGPASERAARAGEVVSRCILLGILIVATMLVLTPLLASAIGGDLPAATRDTTRAALVLLLPAALLHVVSAALSGALGAQGQFGFSALAYVVSGALSLVVSIVAMLAIGPLGAGIGVLAGTLLLAAAHVHRARAHGIRVKLTARRVLERAQLQLSAEVVSGAALGFALQLNLAIALAAIGSQAGAITAYSYAFFMTSLILSLSSLPLALVTLPGLAEAVAERGRDAVAEHLVRFAPYAYAVVLPLVAGFVGFGRPLLELAFEPFVDDGVTTLLFDAGTALVAMAIPATLFYLASAASLPAATPGGRLFAAGATVTLQAAAVTVVAGDARVVAWAHAAAMLAATIVLLGQILGRRAPRAAALALRAVLPVAIAAGCVLLIGLVADGAPAATIAAAAIVAVMVYVLVLQRLAPAVVEPFAALLRRPTVR